MATKNIGTEPDSHEGSDQPMFVDAATRVSNPSAFDDWYYGIEDKLGQGTVAMGACLIVFVVGLIVVAVFKSI